MWSQLNTLFRTSQERVPLSVCYKDQLASKVLGVSSNNVTKLKTIRKRQAGVWEQYLMGLGEGVKKLSIEEGPEKTRGIRTWYYYTVSAIRRPHLLGKSLSPLCLSVFFPVQSGYYCLPWKILAKIKWGAILSPKHSISQEALHEIIHHCHHYDIVPTGKVYKARDSNTKMDFLIVRLSPNGGCCLGR